MENKTFEQKLKELEELVRALEEKTISLEDAVNKYTKGLELAKNCYDTLNTNEQLVIKKMTEFGLVDFDRKD